MSLTLGGGPLAAKVRGETNYAVEGPKNRILFMPFPRRLRALVGGEVVADTESAMLLHETNILPAAYFPIADVDFDLLTATDHTTHCPYKGDAAYWSIQAGGERRENAVWGYPEPTESAPWLVDYVAFYWDRVDTWLDEDVEVRGHLTDPFHRVDIRPTSKRIAVAIKGEAVATTSAALVVSETGLPNRYYLPEEDIDAGLFERSTTTTHCPYKGDTIYWNFLGREPSSLVDVAWSYPTPFDESLALAGHWSFLGDDVEVTVLPEEQR